MMKKILFLLLFLPLGLTIFSQTIVAPNFILKSHETLEVMKVMRYEDGITLQMLITNTRNEGGSFCVDKNTEITANGISYHIQRIENIPKCPKTYKFEYVGEKLIFYLHFPAIPNETKIINIAENCDDNCFQFTGLIIDEKLNIEMNLAFEYFDTGLLPDALLSYKKLLGKYENKEAALEGLFYFYIITILREMDNDDEAREWFERFQQQGLEGSQWVMDKLSN